MKKPFQRKPSFKGKGPNAIFVLLLILVASLGYLMWYNSTHQERDAISTSQFYSLLESHKPTVTVFRGDGHVMGQFDPAVKVATNGHVHEVSRFETTVSSSDGLEELLRAKKIPFNVVHQEQQAWSLYLLLVLFLPMIFIFFYLMSRQGQGGPGGKIFNVGKSRARFFSPNTIKIKFKDVAGVDEAKEDLQDIVDFLKNPEKYKRLGAKVPKGILLTGAPGNGKTLLAKAVAGEAHCPFFSVNGSDFVEVFVGVGASRVRDLFVQARKHAPCIVFIDEIDAVGRHRGAGVGGGNDEREQTLNQLLSEMDGFSTQPGEVIVIAATNRPDVLDKALLRPGRFDRKVEVPYPDLVSREKILTIHTSPVKLANDVDLHRVARGTARFSGADLANLVNEAALIASKKNKRFVDMDDFDLARDKILVGAERKTLTRTEDELRRTAYHEAGHTLTMVLSDAAQPLHKVTILSRGGALGITWYLPEGDEVSKSEDELLTEIRVCLGGRIAEEIVFGKSTRTTGAYNDFMVATRIARDMVCNYGMSDLGPIVYQRQEPGQARVYSEATAQKIDELISHIMESCFEQVRDLLSKNREKLDVLAKDLLEKETLEAQEVYDLLGIPAKTIHSFKPDKKKESRDEQAAPDDEHDAAEETSPQADDEKK